MKTPSKIVIGGVACGALIFGFFVFAFFQAAQGVDASKEDPQKLFAFYVQKQIAPSVKVYGARGHAYPLTGTCIVFRFHISQNDLDDLIAAKRLDKEDSLQEGLFTSQELAALKHPEYYATDKNTSWASSLSTVRMAVDRSNGTALYMVFRS